jgi:hypothetical protein
MVIHLILNKLSKGKPRLEDIVRLWKKMKMPPVLRMPKLSRELRGMIIFNLGLINFINNAKSLRILPISFKISTIKLKSYIKRIKKTSRSIDLIILMNISNNQLILIARRPTLKYTKTQIYFNQVLAVALCKTLLSNKISTQK